MNDTIIILLVAGVVLVGFLLFVYFYNKKQKQSLIYRAADGKFYKKLVCKNSFRYYAFLFRWFLIGKYHCEFKHSYTRKVFEFINKTLWAFIIFSCVISSAMIIQGILGF